MTSSMLLSSLVILPFAGALLISLLRLIISQVVLREKVSRIVTIITPVIVAIIAVSLIVTTDSDTLLKSTIFQWFAIGDLNVSISLMLDPLAMWMILFISLISALIFIYATGYMHKDEGFARFFIYFHLFLGSMMLLVLADNPIVMFIGWEGVGLCSYLLIGFYFKDKENVGAANKAFFLNRVGDFGFVSALGLLFISIGGTGMDYASLAQHITEIDHDRLTWIAILFFVGAMGKSAQIPLYVWLPDAMAGPTPVSALIHAATMVTAGVYMVVRLAFIYNEVPDVGLFIAYIGAFSALVAALFATFASDIKKILAYSTMSQLGYMFVAAGLGAYSQAMFHLFTHAFFKALLFMGAGAVIVAMHHQQNIFKMGALRHFVPAVFISMFFATLAISGIPPFSGFFSKDAITAYAFFSHNYLIWGVITVTAFLTAFYMFRLFFTVFISQPKAAHNQLHIVPISMQWPLILLAIFAIINGFWNLPHYMGGSEMVTQFLALPNRVLHASVQTEWMLTMLNTLLALTATYLAYRKFGTHAKEPNANSFWRRALIEKLYIDQLYDIVFVQGFKKVSLFFIKVVEPLISNTIQFFVTFYHEIGQRVALLQNGDVRFYIILMITGVVILSIYLATLLEAL